MDCNVCSLLPDSQAVYNISNVWSYMYNMYKNLCDTKLSDQHLTRIHM